MRKYEHLSKFAEEGDSDGGEHGLAKMPKYEHVQVPEGSPAPPDNEPL